MKIPRGATGHGEKGRVCHLLMGMYSLKKVGRGWHQELVKVFVQDLKFTQSEVDHSIFYKKNMEEHNCHIAMHNLCSRFQVPGLETLETWETFNGTLDLKSNRTDKHRLYHLLGVCT